MMFIGSKHCPHCGAAAAKVSVADLTVLQCPRCRVAMSSITLGGAPLRECETCAGLWVEVAALEKICADREEQSAVLGVSSTHIASTGSEANKISYAPCPQCGQLMNRMNFARCSGVIVDACKGHGTWFDRDELNRIVEFIRGGGLETSRAKEKLSIQEERDKLRQEQRALDMQRASGLSGGMSDERVTGIASAGGLLDFLLEK